MKLCLWKNDWNPRLTSEKYGMYGILNLDFKVYFNNAEYIFESLIYLRADFKIAYHDRKK